MRYPLPTRIVGPLALPLTLDQAKKHLRIDMDDEEDDGEVTDLIAVAADQVERHTRRALYRQEWMFTLDRFQPIIRLPVPPHIAVESITYVDEGGTARTLDTGIYQFDVQAGEICPCFGQVWPATRWQPGAVKVSWWSGYTDGIVNPDAPPVNGQPAPQTLPIDGDPLNTIPASFKQAMKLLIAHWYENREEVVLGPVVTALPMGVAALLSPLRAWSP